MDNSSPHLTSAVVRSTGSYELVAGAVLFGLLGLLVDRWLGTTPLFLLGFTFLGFIGAAISLYYHYRAQMAALETSTPEKGEAQS